MIDFNFNPIFDFKYNEKFEIQTLKIIANIWTPFNSNFQIFFKKNLILIQFNFIFINLFLWIWILINSYEFIAKQLGLDSPPLGERVETSRAYTNKEVVGSKLRQLGWQPKFATVIDGLREMLEKEAQASTTK